jgi:uncharacterized protein
MKPFSGNGDAINRGALTAEEALRLPVTTTITEIDKPGVMKQNLAIAQTFHRMSAAEMQTLRQRLLPYAGDGRFEL